MKVIFFAITMFLSLVVSAGNTNCGGTVTFVMADNPSCNEFMAFKTSGSGNKWMCTKSKESGSVVLTALAAGKHLDAYIDNTGVTYDPNSKSCDGLPHYRYIGYVIIHP